MSANDNQKNGFRNEKILYTGSDCLDAEGLPLKDDTLVSRLYWLKDKTKNGYFSKKEDEIEMIKNGIEEEISSLKDFLLCSNFAKKINSDISKALCVLNLCSKDMSEKCAGNLMFDNGSQILTQVNNAIRTLDNAVLKSSVDEYCIREKISQLERKLDPIVGFCAAKKVREQCVMICKEKSQRITPMIREIRRLIKIIVSIGCKDDNVFVNPIAYKEELSVMNNFTSTIKQFKI